jgi:CDGSH-type Zn-finger protein
MPESHPENLPKIARYKPYYEELEADKTYLWCACGLSKNQPFCDGSHNNLKDEYDTDDPDSLENKVIGEVHTGYSFRPAGCDSAAYPGSGKYQYFLLNFRY